MLNIPLVYTSIKYKIPSAIIFVFTEIIEYSIVTVWQEVFIHSGTCINLYNIEIQHMYDMHFAVTFSGLGVFSFYLLI